MPAPTSGPCPHCAGAGFYKEAVPFGHSNFGKLLPCVCKLAEREARQQAASRERLARLSITMGDLAGKTFAAFDTRWDKEFAHQQSLAAALDDARQFAADPGDRWLFLTGFWGCGKSHLAAAAAMELAATDRAMVYRSVPEMLNFLRAGFGTGDFDDRVADVSNVSVLVLDDLGAEPQTQANRGLLFAIVNHRVQQSHLTTIITSNAGLEPFKKPDPDIADLDPRLTSRIKQRALVIEIVANDYREHIAERRRARGAHG